jgi:hypothetical protein
MPRVAPLGKRAEKGMARMAGLNVPRVIHTGGGLEGRAVALNIRVAEPRSGGRQ